MQKSGVDEANKCYDNNSNNDLATCDSSIQNFNDHYNNRQSCFATLDNDGHVYLHNVSNNNHSNQVRHSVQYQHQNVYRYSVSKRLIEESASPISRNTVANLVKSKSISSIVPNNSDKPDNLHRGSILSKANSDIVGSERESLLNLGIGLNYIESETFRLFFLIFHFLSNKT